MGVRSFDNTHAQYISFTPPLTLIVGYNGSGKTTIIECLKYATTGDLPPNSKTGGAFIHDPKLCGEKEVMAQVKLSFKSSNGAKMVVTRSLQLTVKRTKREQKTLDCSLLTIRNGERAAISSRVAELNQILPQYLGVSKAVLENVIFCHQDESLWPMSEPTVLKEKFNKIFEVEKYTKAIDNIKVLRKKQSEELAKLKIEESQYKIDKDRGERAEKKSRELSDELDKLRYKIEELSSQLREAQVQSNELFKHARNFEGVIAELNAAELQAEHAEETVAKLESRLKEMAESDDWLQSTLDQYDDRIKEMHRKVENTTAEYKQLGRRVQQTRDDLDKKVKEDGRLEAEKDTFERQLEQRERLVRETAARHSFRGFAQELDDHLVQEFITKLTRQVRDQAQAVEKAKQDVRSELNEAQKIITDLETKISGLNSTKETAKREITNLDTKSITVQSQINKINVDEGSKAVLESVIQDTQTRLEEEKSTFETAAWDAQITKTDGEKRQIEDMLKGLHTELSESTKKTRDLAHLEILQKSYKDSRQRLETNQGAHGDRITKVLGSEWEPDALEQMFESFSKRQKNELSEAEQQRSAANREHELIEFKLNGSKQALKAKNTELIANEKKIKDATGEEITSYEDMLQELEQSRDIRKADVDNFANLKKYFQSCVETANKKKECRMCRRGFDKTKQLEEFVGRLQKQANKGSEDLEEELRDLEGQLSSYRSVRIAFDLYVRLKSSDIPDLEGEVQKFQKQLAEKRRVLDEQDLVVSDLESKQRDVDSIKKDVELIVKLNYDTNSFSAKISDHMSQAKSSGLTRTLDEIQNAISENMSSLNSLGGKLSKVKDDKARALSSINNTELELRDAKEKFSTANYELQQKLGLHERLDEIKTSLASQRSIIQSSDEVISQTTPQAAQATARRDGIQQRGAEQEKRLQDESNKLNDSLYKVKLSEKDIRTYIDSGGPSRIAACKKALRELRSSIETQEGEQQALSRSIAEMQDYVKGTDETKRQIQDNIDYREERRKLTSLHERISTLRSKNAEHDRDRYTAEAGKVERRIQLLNAERSSESGSAKSKDDELQRLLQEWETDYKDSATKYKEAHIKVETTKAAITDLGRYGQALDQAIMEYHSLKMEEINRIIEELWRRTYQGTDVDTILIRSDNEGTSTSANRSYKYRVVMVKQDTEMDMRGRCSAGQKVLASIIIRLALAECFGTNCGLIALDEPTTNLDRDNIRALADALHDIIDVRRQQDNFQLILITHDEEFLRYMRCGDHAEKYFRVMRDERQKSVVKMQSIQEVL